MSRTPNSRKHETHERIVDVAARAIRRHGYAGVGVADVMKEAGLTHGGFYAHFDSRDALIVEALERAGRDSGEAVTRARRAPSGEGRERLPGACRGLPRRRAPRVARDRLPGGRAGVRHAAPVGCRARSIGHARAAARRRRAVGACRTHRARRRAWWPARSSARCNSRARWAPTPTAAPCCRRHARRSSSSTTHPTRRPAEPAEPTDPLQPSLALEYDACHIQYSLIHRRLSMKIRQRRRSRHRRQPRHRPRLYARAARARRAQGLRRCAGPLDRHRTRRRADPTGRDQARRGGGGRGARPAT